VGPDIVPTVAAIRAKFEHRREEPGTVDGIMRRLMGLDVKLRQYSDGRRFVSMVVDEVGRDGFNRVWGGPDLLPTRAEILNPHAWSRRVAGDLLR
jgi:putative hydrolase